MASLFGSSDVRGSRHFVDRLPESTRKAPERLLVVLWGRQGLLILLMGCGQTKPQAKPLSVELWPRTEHNDLCPRPGSLPSSTPSGCALSLLVTPGPTCLGCVALRAAAGFSSFFQKSSLSAALTSEARLQVPRAEKAKAEHVMVIGGRATQKLSCFRVSGELSEVEGPAEDTQNFKSWEHEAL